MINSSLLNVTDPSTYWSEAVGYLAPYAKIGSLILSGFSLASELRQEKRLEEISKKLDEIKTLILQSRRALERKLNDIPLRERTGEVLGIEEALNEYRNLQSQGILDNIISDSAQTKRKIKTFIDADDTPADYRAAYCGLYTTLLPLRVAAFEMFERPIESINPLVKSEMEDLMEVEAISVRTAETIGDRRVSGVQTEAYLVDELGPIFGTHFSVKVDNDRRPLGTFIPGQGDLATIRGLANETRSTLGAQKATEAAAPFREVFAATTHVLAAIA